MPDTQTPDGAPPDVTILSDASAPSTHTMRPPEARCFGFALPLSGRPLFLVLTLAAIGSAVLFAALQEGVFQVPGFKFSGWMTFVTAATMAVCGHLELLVTGSRQRVGTLDQYLRLSLLTLAGMYLTNASLKYLNYSTRVLFKSSKLLPTMLLGTLMQGRRYSFLEYLAAGGLVGGITLFTLGDADTLPSFHLAGVGLILLGIAADAATSNFEEKAFFRAVTPVPPAASRRPPRRPPRPAPPVAAEVAPSSSPAVIAPQPSAARAPASRSRPPLAAPPASPPPWPPWRGEPC